MTNRADRVYDVNIRRLALLVLPTWLRRPLAGALIHAGVSPLGRLLQELRACRAATLYRLRHNGQVCRLRGALNDGFDPGLRRIRIEDGQSAGTVEASFVHTRDTGRWVMLPRRGEGAALVHREGFGGTGGYDFWVTVPEELRPIETRLRAMVNMYKLAGKRHAVIYK